MSKIICEIYCLINRLLFTNSSEIVFYQENTPSIWLRCVLQLKQYISFYILCIYCSFTRSMEMKRSTFPFTAVGMMKVRLITQMTISHLLCCSAYINRILDRIHTNTICGLNRPIKTKGLCHNRKTLLL